VNGLYLGTRYEGTAPYQGINSGSCADSRTPIAKWSQEKRETTRKFIEAQLDAYEMASGWIFWTAKTEATPGSDNSWDMGLLIEHGIFPQPFDDRISGGCGVVHPSCGH
jgi:glucan 1,3-beta-glucosidase